MVMPLADSTLQSDDLEVAAVSAVDALRSAQSSAMTGRNNKQWGVHFEASSFTVFEGGTYSAGAAQNEVHDLGGRVAVTDVTLSPGGSCDVDAGTGNCEVHFADAGGQPTESGTVVLTNDANETRTVSINVEGMIEQN
jgi:Tfp pilus assembly protein FimT